MRPPSRSIKLSKGSFKLRAKEQKDVLRAWAKPLVRDELGELGVQVFRGAGADHIYVPPDDAEYIHRNAGTGTGIRRCGSGTRGSWR